MHNGLIPQDRQRLNREIEIRNIEAFEDLDVVPSAPKFRRADLAELLSRFSPEAAGLEAKTEAYLERIVSAKLTPSV